VDSEYLCFQSKDDGADIFQIAEFGFESMFPRQRYPNGIPVTNYFECYETDQRNYNLLKSIIFRSRLSRVKKNSEYDAPLEVIDSQYYDATYQSCETTEEDKDNGDHEKRKYGIFDHECLYPEYLVEYSLEKDHIQKNSQLEKLIIDIAFSNRISHANMPMIVQELSSKIKSVLELLTIELLERSFKHQH
jgi:hypothetical protein